MKKFYKSSQTALIADSKNNLEILVTSQNRDLSNNELLLAAVAIRSKDSDWVAEMLQFLSRDDQE